MYDSAQSLNPPANELTASPTLRTTESCHHESLRSSGGKLLIAVVLALGCLFPHAALSDGDRTGDLDHALSLVPRNIGSVFFTNWSLIKTQEGFEGLDGRSSEEEKLAFVGSLKAHSPPSWFGGPRTMRTVQGRSHADEWGWDTTDLVWELQGLSLDTGDFYILKLSEHFDIEGLADALDEKGFVLREYEGFPVYSFNQSMSALRTTGFDIRNTAIVQGDGLLILSTHEENIKKVLDVCSGKAKSLLDSPYIEGMTDPLRGSAGVHIYAGLDICLRFGGNMAAEMLHSLIAGKSAAETVREIEEKQKGTPTVYPYTGMGVGYRYEAEKLLCTLVLHYLLPDQAQADSKTRFQWAGKAPQQQTAETFLRGLFFGD